MQILLLYLRVYRHLSTGIRAVSDIISDMRHYLLDGHNIIHRNDRLKTVFTSDAARALNQLISRCRQMVSGKNNRCSIYFDGAPPGNIITGSANVSVIFSYNKPADVLIKSLIARSINPRNIIVVSDDAEIQRFARAHSCAIETAGNFGHHTLSAGKTDDMEKPVNDDTSIEEWLALFNRKKK